MANGATVAGTGGRQVFVVDGSSFMFRAFHQAQNQDERYNKRSDGQPIGAVRLFAAKMYQFVRQGAAGVMPSHLVVVFDKGTDKSWRKAAYPGYKANRPPMDPLLKAQVGLVRDVVRAFGIEAIESDGVEGDDLVAAYTRAAREAGHEVLVVTSDKDMMQLVGEGVRFYDFESGRPGKPGYRPERLLDEAGVAERWEGILPSALGDALALLGDTSDNVPGVDGVGLKTAAKLLAEHGSLEGILAAADAMKRSKLRDRLVEGAETARLSRRLVALQDDVALPVPLADLGAERFEPRRLIAFLKAMELARLVGSVAKDHRIDPDAVAVDAERAARPDADDPEAETLSVVRAPYAADAYETIQTRAALDALVAEFLELPCVALHVEGTREGIVGIGLSAGPHRSAYVPIGHRVQGGLFGDPAADGQLLQNQVLDGLRPLLASGSVAKVFHDAKGAFRLLGRFGAQIGAAYEDVMLASYALDCGLGGHDVGEICARHMIPVPKTPTEVAGGKGRSALPDLGPRQATLCVAATADAVMRIWALLGPRLAARDLSGLYYGIDLPLCPVVARMETHGVLVDRKALTRLSGEFGKEMERLEGELQRIAGEKLSVSSPRQVGDIMFDKLGLPGGKRTASGQWETRQTLLDELAEQGHEFPARLVEYRRVAKLKATYADALRDAIDPLDARVHTTFGLAATNTGRFASSDPNLQNIPVRTEEGRRIRRAFVAPEGHKLVSADYSQVELRLLAHIADIPELKQAFLDGVDIHAATASAMFGVGLADVSGELRRRAKTINFGIIYGISAFGLATRLGIPQGEAASFIRDYFERFPGIRDYIEGTKAQARADGFVRTLYGRVLHFPGIRSNNPTERAGIERAAINAPIQGTAADVVRRATAMVSDALSREGLRARMLLQVHDELVFEVPDEEVEATKALVVGCMEAAPGEAVALTVPLVVEAKAALDWDEAH